MKQPTFVEGAILALIAAISGSVLFSLLQLVMPAETILRLLIPLLSLGYGLYLMSRCRERLGRITAFSAWLLTALSGVLLDPSLILLLLLHSALIWILRSLYFHNGVLTAAGDLALTAMSLAAALWASLHTGNLFLAIWCYFLTHALFVALPEIRPGKAAHRQIGEERFSQAYQTAEKALSKLLSSPQTNRR